MDANADIEVGRLLRDGAHGAQHPVLVVLGRRRGSRRQDDLAAVGCDVRRHPVDPVDLCRIGHDGSHAVEMPRDSGRSLDLETIRLRELHERDGDMTMLGGRTDQHFLTLRVRNESRRVDAASRDAGYDVAMRSRRCR